MKYNNIVAARFLRRDNRFVAHVELDGREEIVHVKNTGRCKELLIPGCTVYLEGSENPNRKTRYDLVTVEKIRPGKTELTVKMANLLMSLQKKTDLRELLPNGSIL